MTRLVQRHHANFSWSHTCFGPARHWCAACARMAAPDGASGARPAAQDASASVVVVVREDKNDDNAECIICMEPRVDTAACAQHAMCARCLERFLATEIPRVRRAGERSIRCPGLIADGQARCTLQLVLPNVYQTALAAPFPAPASQPVPSSVQRWPDILAAMLSSLYITCRTRNCPHCGAPSERIGGCRYITCGACHRLWCWRCGNVSPHSCRCTLVDGPIIALDQLSLMFDSALAAGRVRALFVSLPRSACRLVDIPCSAPLLAVCLLPYLLWLPIALALSAALMALYVSLFGVWVIVTGLFCALARPSYHVEDMRVSTLMLFFIPDVFAMAVTAGAMNREAWCHDSACLSCISSSLIWLIFVLIYLPLAIVGCILYAPVRFLDVACRKPRP